jgi:hypothetical protein
MTDLIKAPDNSTPTETPSPNQDWKNNPNLDEQGNPITKEAPTQEPIVKEEPTPDGDPVKEAPIGEEPPKEEPTPEPTKFNADAVKQVESFLTDAGLKPSDVALGVTQENGAIPLETMKALVDKHGEAIAGLIADKLRVIHESNVGAAKAADKQIFSSVQEAFKDTTTQSGKDTWNELSGWAKKNMSAEDRNGVNAMLAAGGFQAKAAVEHLIKAFKGSDSFIAQPAQLMQGDDTSKEYGGKPLDKHSYNTELRKLLDSGKSENSPEIVALNRRRDRSRSRGY